MADISIGVIIGSAFNKVVGIYRSLIKVRRINLKASDNSTTFDLVKISLEIYYR
jgi:large-conductance mechanosensitive channel